MHLKNLSLLNFKNLTNIDIELSEKINCFVGKNGAGKTNILDSIYYLSFCKSYFNYSDNQNIKHGEEFFMIQGNYIKNNEEEKIHCGVKLGSKKQFKRNNKEYARLADHIGLLPLVMLSPADTKLIVGGSDERRKFIDGVISQFNKQYLDYVIKYNRVLSHRNKLLKEFGKNKFFDNESIEIWNEQLVFFGNKIYAERQKFIDEFQVIFQKYYKLISGNEELVSLKYNSQLHSNDFSKLLVEAKQKDSIMQYSTVGIHKDDLSLTLEDYPIKKVGSQGQQKTYLISLKMAQFDVLKKLSNKKPIILLDDIFDKLDRYRVKQIVELVANNNFGQIFISDTNKTRVEEILEDIKIDFKIFVVDGGDL